MSEVGVEIIKTEETQESGVKYLNINVSNSEVERDPDVVRLCADAGILEYAKPKTGHWILQPSNKEQGERDFIWWKCSKCGQVIYSETEKDRREFHAFCSRCGAKMVEPQEGSDIE